MVVAGDIGGGIGDGSCNRLVEVIMVMWGSSGWWGILADIGGSIGDGSCNRLVEVIMVVWGSSKSGP